MRCTYLIFLFMGISFAIPSCQVADEIQVTNLKYNYHELLDGGTSTEVVIDFENSTGTVNQQISGINPTNYYGDSMSKNLASLSKEKIEKIKGLLQGEWFLNLKETYGEVNYDDPKKAISVSIELITSKGTYKTTINGPSGPLEVQFFLKEMVRILN